MAYKEGCRLGQIAGIQGDGASLKPTRTVYNCSLSSHLSGRSTAPLGFWQCLYLIVSLAQGAASRGTNFAQFTSQIWKLRSSCDSVMGARFLGFPHPAFCRKCSSGNDLHEVVCENLIGGLLPSPERPPVKKADMGLMRSGCQCQRPPTPSLLLPGSWRACQEVCEGAGSRRSVSLSPPDAGGEKGALPRRLWALYYRAARLGRAAA